MTTGDGALSAALMPAPAGAADRLSIDPLLARFPPRAPLPEWPMTQLAGPEVRQRLLGAPFPADGAAGECNRQRGLHLVLRWLEGQPGDTWQQRWLASGAEDDGREDWRSFPIQWGTDAGALEHSFDERVMTTGLLSLVCADVIRPGLDWLLTTKTPKRLAIEMARVRDPDGFAALAARCELRPVGESTTRVALHRIAVLLAAKGGRMTDITPGDCLQLVRVANKVCPIAHYRSAYFYQLLHSVGIFGRVTAPTLSALTAQRQLSVEQLIDRCGLQSRPVRDLLVDYLLERQITLDHVSMVRLADTLGRLFWSDLESHHPGIASLRLTPAVAAAWKQRILTKTTRRTRPDGSIEEVRSLRESTTNCLSAVRSFYLDIAQWTTDDPVRWGPWAVPCPIKSGEIPHKRDAVRRKSRMDQRTRERLPMLPALVAAVNAGRTSATKRLVAARATEPGALFTAGGFTLRRSTAIRAQVVNIWAEDPTSGARRNLTLEEHRAFWAWAAVEVLRHTGVRIEELTELTHPSVVQYRLPTTGELVPLLHIAPSKTDAELLLVISPELADVLSAIICRVRDEAGAVPLVVAYDCHERVFNPPLPILFQRHVGTDARPISAPAIRTQQLLGHLEVFDHWQLGVGEVGQHAPRAAPETIDVGALFGQAIEDRLTVGELVVLTEEVQQRVVPDPHVEVRCQDMEEDRVDLPVGVTELEVEVIGGTTAGHKVGVAQEHRSMGGICGHAVRPRRHPPRHRARPQPSLLVVLVRARLDRPAPADGIGGLVAEGVGDADLLAEQEGLGGLLASSGQVECAGLERAKAQQGVAATDVDELARPVPDGPADQTLEGGP